MAVLKDYEGVYGERGPQETFMENDVGADRPVKIWLFEELVYVEAFMCMHPVIMSSHRSCPPDFCPMCGWRQV
jgi:hypothetical protein